MFGQSLDPLRRSIPTCEYSPIGVCVCEDECLYVEPDMRRILASWPATDRELFLKVVRLMDAGKFRTRNVRERHSTRISQAERAGAMALIGRESYEKEESWPETTPVDLGPVMQTKFGW